METTPSSAERVPEEQPTIAAGRTMLARQGLNLFAVLACSTLTEGFHAAVRNAGIPATGYPSLILVGHGGNAMWRRLQTEGRNGPDPVDAYSTTHVLRFLETCLPGRRHVMLYPGSVPIPLQQLGALAGWHHSSPLGLGVHSHFGPWFGYRAAVLVDAELTPMTTPPTPSPCSTCSDKPCIAACPAQALSVHAAPQLPACVAYRVAEDSPCAFKCKARLACPVGGEHRYVDSQLRYYYARSLRSIREHMR